jgi:hypothetical protein
MLLKWYYLCKEMGEVVVYILQSRVTDITGLQELFSNSYFSVVVKQYTTPQSIINIIAQSTENKPLLLVLDTSMSNLSPNNMAEKVNSALTLAPTASIYYLSKWLDDCAKLRVVSSQDPQLKWCAAPQGTQALILPVTTQKLITSSQGTSIEDIITPLLNSGKLTAVCYTPNIIFFNITLATKDSDVEKLNECDYYGDPDPNTNNSAGYVWLTLIFLVVLVVAWGALRNA